MRGLTLHACEGELLSARGRLLVASVIIAVAAALMAIAPENALERQARANSTIQQDALT